MPKEGIVRVRLGRAPKKNLSSTRVIPSLVQFELLLDHAFGFFSIGSRYARVFITVLLY